MSEKQEFVNQRIVCRGGSISTRNWLDLNDNYSTYGTLLINFEPSLYGGYRRLSGYQPLEGNEPEVDPVNAEGPILGVFFRDDQIICARKQQSGPVYNFYTWNPSVGWTPATTGLTLTSTNVVRVRYDTWNFDGTEYIGFVDGVNGLTIFDGTTWTQVQWDVSTNTQMINDVKYIQVYQNHIFLSGASSAPHLVIHSAPFDPEDFSAASGAGQIVAGFEVVQIAPFRENLYVFGNRRIKKISVDNTTGSFLINDVVQNLGCIAPDSVVEVNGDLVFLSQDGFRPISATERIGDIEIGSISKNIQKEVLDLIQTYNTTDITGLVVKNKSQVRWFFSNSLVGDDNASGVLMGIQNSPQGQTYEWTQIRGIKTSCAESKYIGTVEYTIHGTFDGKVMRQEIGNTFDGRKIEAVYQTPYLDFGDSELRKTVRSVRLFTRPEGSLNLSLGLKFDWGNTNAVNPLSYPVTTGTNPGVYGVAVYGVDVYGGSFLPAGSTQTSGSFYSIQLSIVDDNSSSPFSIQGIVIEFSVDGRE